MERSTEDSRFIQAFRQRYLLWAVMALLEGPFEVAYQLHQLPLLDHFPAVDQIVAQQGFGQLTKSALNGPFVTPILSPRPQAV